MRGVFFYFFTVSQCQEQDRDTMIGKPKAVPHCRTCGHPMKGHKNVKNCPKNNPEAQDDHQED